MIDSSKKCNHQLAFEIQNSHVFEKHSKNKTNNLLFGSCDTFTTRFSPKMCQLNSPPLFCSGHNNYTQNRFPLLH